MKQPLAYRMRPETIDEVIGQKHLLGPGKILQRAVEKKQLFSMIFYGPPGTGKTTLARCLARQLEMPYRLFNAVTGNKKDLDGIFLEAKLSGRIVLIIDEVHRLNKDKQDLLLPHVEDGNVLLIGATTSNPLFAINPAIRSRCQLLEIKPLTVEEVAEALQRAVSSEKGLNNEVTLTPEAAKMIAIKSNGDVRFAMNLLEVCSLASDEITQEIVEQYGAVPNAFIDHDDDGHYDAVSAFQKSIRGSDVNAALYYLAKLIQAGDMDSIERRLLVTAYEDIGLANPAAVGRTINAIDAAKRVGFPEAVIPLGVAIIDLTLSPKSKSGCQAIHAAVDEVNTMAHPTPEYLRLTPVNMKEEDKYPYDRPDLWPHIQYLPDALKHKEFYQPNTNSSYEAQLARNYETLKKYARSKKLAELKRRKG
ncbi:MAG: replication-associated recombination protein A [Erysipelotrichaceae bacterium]|nr:replication-associated recombination protein A [Erysipelotrichaceae bacterium]